MASYTWRPSRTCATGLASNLLTERLRTLEELELIAKVDGPYNVTLYELADRGELARAALAGLGKLGLALGIVDPRQPRAEGSLRFLAMPLQALVEEGLPTPAAIDVGPKVDDEWFTVAVTDPGQTGDQQATVRQRRTFTADAVIEVGYDVVADVLIGGGDPRRLLDDAIVTRGDAHQLEALVSALERAVAAMRGG